MSEEFRYVWDFIYLSALFLAVAILILSVSSRKFVTKFGLAVFVLQAIIALAFGKPTEQTIFTICLSISLFVLYFAKRKKETSNLHN